MIDEIYSISESQIDSYQKNKCIKLKKVFDQQTIAYYNHIISEVVDEINDQYAPLEERDTYGKAFLQLFNLWQLNDEIKRLVLSKRLAGIARDLMKVDGVRIYHDQALFKEAGGGITPWHADQFYWPLSTDKTITAWIPLQNTPLDLGPLEFSAGSHQIIEGRDLDISEESERILSERLKVTDFEHVIEPFDIGEVSFHSGWVFHRAGANQSEQMRKVMTVIYMDRDMVLKEPDNENQRIDWEKWCPGAKVGEIIDTPLNPVAI